MPNCSDSCINQAVKLANRISLNIESPTQADLSNLSPDKDLKTGFFDTVFKVKSILTKLKNQSQKVPSLTTQFIVGAGTETDKDIVQTTSLLYKNFSFKRVFYSAFRPVSDTPLSDKPAESPTRQHRLYQADFLLRFYNFSPSDLFEVNQDQLSSQIDPKMIWAQNHPQFFPINLNKADFWQLLRVPGIGPATAKKIIKLRQFQKISLLSQLANQRIQLDKVKKYVSY
jgi:predicted DNA-binding helix-hairpin-helix protein